MSDIPRIKLIPGETRVRGSVELVDPWSGDYGANYTLTIVTDDGPVEIVDKAEKIDAQLKRLGLDATTAIGQMLEFSKAPMKTDPTKGFLNIDRPRGVAAPAAKPAAAKPSFLDGPPEPTGKAHGSVSAQITAEVRLAAVQADYASATDFVLREIVPKWEAAEIGATPEAVNSAVATILIGAQRR